MFPDLPATVELANRTKLKLSGADRVRYLNGQVTNDVTTLNKPGASLYACVTNAKGKLEADVFITELQEGEDAFLIDADPALREELHARLDKYIIADDVQLEDVTDSIGIIHLLEDNPGASGLPLPDAASILIASPVNRFGTSGTDLIFPVEARDAVLAALPELVEPELIESFRIDHGIPKWGAELTPDILPPEAGLQDRAISYTKGCYIGQEVISRIKSVGRVNKQLVSLAGAPPLAGAVPPNTGFQPGLTLYTDNPEKPLAIGVLTSCTSNGTLDTHIALGYVKRDHTAPGTRVFAGNDANPRAYSLEIGKTPLI